MHLNFVMAKSKLICNKGQALIESAFVLPLLTFVGVLMFGICTLWLAVNLYLPYKLDEALICKLTLNSTGCEQYLCSKIQKSFGSFAEIKKCTIYSEGRYFKTEISVSIIKPLNFSWNMTRKISKDQSQLGGRL